MLTPLCLIRSWSTFSLSLPVGLIPAQHLTLSQGHASQSFRHQRMGECGPVSPHLSHEEFSGSFCSGALASLNRPLGNPLK